MYCGVSDVGRHTVHHINSIHISKKNVTAYSFLDAGKQVDVIYTDFEKAFDKVTHHALINKLLAYGLDNTVVLNYAGEYSEYCDARQAAVTVIRGSAAALKCCLEWFTMSYIISDSAYLISV